MATTTTTETTTGLDPAFLAALEKVEATAESWRIAFEAERAAWAARAVALEELLSFTAE